MADTTPVRSAPPPAPSPATAGWITPAVLVVLGLVLGVVQYQAKPRPDPADVAAYADNFTRPEQWIGRPAPPVDTALVGGERYRLSDDIGRRVVILNFFATWCAPCRKEMPELQRYAAAQGDDVRLIGIDAREAADLVATFAREVGVTFPIAIDASGDLLTAYGVTAFPTTVVIGADGRVKLYETGAISNADITFGATVAAERQQLAAGRGISPDAWRAALAAAPPLTTAATPAAATTALSGRAARIAAAMPCPCGCDDRIDACSCQTARAITARLAAGDFGDKTDAQIMEALNAEFCMKGM